MSFWLLSFKTTEGGETGAGDVVGNLPLGLSRSLLHAVPASHHLVLMISPFVQSGPQVRAGAGAQHQTEIFDLQLSSGLAVNFQSVRCILKLDSQSFFFFIYKILHFGNLHSHLVGLKSAIPQTSGPFVHRMYLFNLPLPSPLPPSA